MPKIEFEHSWGGKETTLQKIKNFTSPSTFSNLKKKHLKGFGKDENIIQLIFYQSLVHNKTHQHKTKMSVWPNYDILFCF